MWILLCSEAERVVPLKRAGDIGSRVGHNGAAIYCQGSREYLKEKNIIIKLLNFGKIYTSMIKKYVRQNSPNVISPSVAALKICKIFDKGI